MKTSILCAISEERRAQDRKWGEQNHSHIKWTAILTEECGEVAKASLEKNSHEYRRELVQVAAVAIAALESLERED